MKFDRQVANRTRQDILDQLTDDELRQVAVAEENRIPEGDEYLDLEHLDRGVLIAEPNTSGANAVAHSAVSDATWSKILTVLETPIAPC